MRITAKSIAALTLPAGKSDVIHFDDETPGFGFRLRRSAAGTVNATWVAQYRRAGATRRVLIGAGSVLTAEQARKRAREVLAQATLGADPQKDKAERRSKDRLSLRSVIDDYLAVKRGEVRPGTMREVTRYLVGPYFRLLHSMPIDIVTRRDVAAAVLATQRKHGANVAALARSTLGSFFTWSLQQGLCESNPVIGTRQPKTGEPRSRVLTNSELVAIWKACRDDDYGKIVRSLICTGCRRREIGGMKFAEWDAEQGTWTIPPERSKNGRAHTLPLMPLMLEIIRSVPCMATREHLFGTRSSAGFCTWAQGKAELDARSGVSNWRVHDIRRTVASGLADLGVMPHVIEQILNHQSGHKRGVAGVYNRSSYEREVRSALALWEGHLRALIEGGGERRVLPFQPSAS
jgi:integrase